MYDTFLEELEELAALHKSMGADSDFTGEEKLVYGFYERVKEKECKHTEVQNGPAIITGHTGNEQTRNNK